MAEENIQIKLPQNGSGINQATIGQGAEDQTPRWLRTRCPNCHQGFLDYDGLLNRVCPDCGYQEGSCFT